MAGQLIQRGDRVWLVRVFLGRDGTGKRQFHNKTVHGTKKQAQEYLTKTLRERDTGSFVEPSQMSVGEYLTHWLETAAKGSVRARTYSDYCSITRRYLVPAFGARKLGQLTPISIQGLYTDLQGRGLSARTVRYAHAVLHGALVQAVKWRMLAHNPAEAVNLPRLRRKEMTVLSAEQATRFLNAARSFPADPSRAEGQTDLRGGQQDRWYALWMLLVTTGLRPGEALGLKWSDLDGDRLSVQRTIVERGGSGTWTVEEPKTARGRRVVTLPASVVRVFESHRARQAAQRLAAGPTYTDQGFIFATSTGAPERQSNLFRRHFKPLLRAAGLPEIRMYDLRHTAATLCLAAGENPKIVSERLGHSTITLTMDTYSHVLPDMQQGTAEKLEVLLFGT